MSTFLLQIIAMITMTIDHVAMVFLENNIIMRSIGRIAFPIYAFLLADGFLRYKDDSKRLSSHVIKLILLTIVSEFCYDLMEKGLDFELYMDNQSVMFTLLIALIGLIAINKWKDNPLRVVLVIIITCMAQLFIKSDYKVVGILLVYAFYYYNSHVLFPKYGKAPGYIKRWLILLLIFVIYVFSYNLVRVNFQVSEAYVEKLVSSHGWYFMYVIGVPLILAGYTGKHGYHSKTFSYIYSWYYPAHMLIIGIIAVAIPVLVIQ